MDVLECLLARVRVQVCLNACLCMCACPVLFECLLVHVRMSSYVADK